MKKKIFDGKLFREGIKQSRVYSFTVLSILMLISLLLPVARWLEISGGEKSAVYLNLAQMNLAVYAVMYVGAPFLIFLLFRFLYQRNGSDFYHAIPQTRLCLFVSFFMAGVFWMTVMLFVPGLAAAGMTSLFHQYFRVDVVLLLNHLVHLWVGAVYLMAIVALGMAVTGSFFSGVLVAAMIFVLPRLFVFWFDMIVKDFLPMVANGDIIPFINVRRNIPMGTIVGDLIGYSFHGEMTMVSMASLAYTAVLAVFFLLLAAFFFVRRRSETATRPAPTRKVQAIYRIAATFTVSLLPVTMMFWCILEREFTPRNFFYLFLFFVVCAVVYFVYELLTTLTWRNLLSIIPGFGVVLALDVCMVAALFFTHQHQAGICPAPQEISSVSLMVGEEVTYVQGIRMTDYFSALAGNLECDTDRSKEIVSEGLRRTLKDYEEDGILYNPPGLFPVQIRVGRSVYYRYLELSEEEIKELYAEFGKIPAFAEIYEDLPKEPKVLEARGLNEEQSRELYQVLLTEKDSMSFDEWYVICEKEEDKNSNYANIIFGDYIGDRMHASVIPISARTPRTAEAYVRLLNENGMDEMMKILDHPEEWSQVFVNMTIYFPDDSLSWVQTEYLTDTPGAGKGKEKSGDSTTFRVPDSEASFEEVKALIRECADEGPDWGKNAVVNVHVQAIKFISEEENWNIKEQKNLDGMIYCDEDLFEKVY